MSDFYANIYLQFCLICCPWWKHSGKILGCLPLLNFWTFFSLSPFVVSPPSTFCVFCKTEAFTFVCLSSASISFVCYRLTHLIRNGVTNKNLLWDSLRISANHIYEAVLLSFRWYCCRAVRILVSLHICLITNTTVRLSDDWYCCLETYPIAELSEHWYYRGAVPSLLSAIKLSVNTSHCLDVEYYIAVM